MENGELRALVRSLPKAELHLHVEGTLEPELAFELARRNGVRLPYDSVDELRRAYRFADLQSFLDLYEGGAQVLRTEQDFYDLTRAYLDRARRQGVVHAEVMVDPQLHTGRGVPLAAVVEGLCGALEEARREHAVTSRLILSFLRDRGAEEAMRTFDQARRWLDRFAAVGLDSAEAGHPPGAFAEVYAAARAEGLSAVAHAGEEGPPAYVWQALDVLRVDRVDHGVRAIEDPRLLERLATDQVPLDVCPLSNVALGVVPDLDAHALPALLDAGVLVTINSDDPAYFGGYVEDNYVAVAQAFVVNRLLRSALLGSAAGAAGTTALNAVTYLDMAVRGRPASSTPEDTVERLSETLHVPVPGSGEVRTHRVAGLGPLTGLLAGVGIGALLGACRAAGWRPRLGAATTAATVGALVGTNGPMTVLGVTDPRTWPASSWVADVVPHLAYGAVTAAVLDRLDA